MSDHLLPLNLSTKMMPEAPKTHLQGGQAIAILPATYLANLMTFYVIFLVIIVVTEKEKGYIESMKVMGLRPSVYWLSWIILYAGIMFFVSVLALTLAKLLNIWPHSNFLLLLTDCMMFGLSTIALGFCIAPFFRRPLIAGLVTYAFMQVFGFLYLVETFVPLLSNRARWGVALLAPAAYFMTLSRVGDSSLRNLPTVHGCDLVGCASRGGKIWNRIWKRLQWKQVFVRKCYLDADFRPFVVQSVGDLSGEGFSQ